MRGRSVAVALCLVIGACGGSNSSDPEQAVDEVAEPTEAARPPAPEARTLTIDGVERPFKLFVPDSLSSDPAPLVLNLHGVGGRGDEVLSESNFNVVAQDEGIIVAYPDAQLGEWNFDDNTDVDFLAAIIDDVTSDVPVDLSRVYAIGFSQGGDFSTSLPCRDAGRYAAVASVSVLNHHAACPGSNPAAVLAFVGTTDAIYSIEEGLLIDVPVPDPPGPLTDEIDGWVATNQCDESPNEEALPKDVIRREYACETGALVVYIHGGGHVWPTEGHGIDASRAIWDFLNLHQTTP